MDYPLQKDMRVLFWTGMIEPQREGVSKEVFMLHHYFRDSFVIGISPNGGFRYSREERYLGIPYTLLPTIRLWAQYAQRNFKLSHIIQGINNYHYLKAIKRKPVILTAISVDGMLSIEHYQKVDKVVVECNRDRDTLLSYGFRPDKIELIYPGVDLSAFDSGNQLAEGRFKVLFLSSPFSFEYMEPRGIQLLLNVAKILEDVEFILLWRKRGDTYPKVTKWIKELSLPNVKLMHEDVKDMREMYIKTHATVLPFTTDKFTKSCPNSAIESLTARRPLLISDEVGVSDIVQSEACGVVFNPTVEGLKEAIVKLQHGYFDYQKKARSCAIKYFDKSRFIQSYEGLYRKFI